MKITKSILLIVLAFTCFSQENVEEITKERNNLIGVNTVYLGGEFNRGLEIEYRKILPNFNIRGTVGVLGINSNRDKITHVMGVDEDGIVNLRYSSKDKIALSTSLGLEKMYDLPINGDLFLGFDLLYMRILDGTSYQYANRDYNSTEPSEGMLNADYVGGYYRELIQHDMGLNLNLGINFNVTKRFSIITKLSQSLQYSSLASRLNNESGEALYNENTLTQRNNVFLYKLFMYAISFNWRI